MKKLLVLALVAAIAGIGFADTDPVFSGTFSAYWGFDLNAGRGDQIIDDASDAMKIDLKATIDDFNTISVTVGIADALYWDDINDNEVMNSNNLGGDRVRPASPKVPAIPATATTPEVPEVPAVPARNDGELAVAGDEVENRADYLRMEEFTLTSDILGALGVRGPVGLKIKLGKFKFPAASVVNVAPLSTKDADGSDGLPSDIGIGLDIIILDMVTFGTVIYMDQWVDDAWENEKERAEVGFTVKAMGIAGILDVAAYYMHSNYDPRKKENPDEDIEDPDGKSLGFSAAVAIMSGVKVGAGFEYDLDDVSHKNEKDGNFDDLGVAKAQLDVSFSMIDNLALGLSVGMDDLSKDDLGTAIKLSATYNIMSSLGVFGGIGFSNLDDFDTSDDGSLTYDAGVTASLGSMAILLGATNSMDLKAPEDDWTDVVYVKLSTSF